MSKITTEQYSLEAAATDEKNYSTIQERMGQEFNAKLIHYVLGVGTEAGELQDALKKSLIYGKELDKTNLVEEAGDILWYLSRLLSALGSSFEEAMYKNNAKLKARFGEKFTEFAALNRNLELEREILEKTGE